VLRPKLFTFLIPVIALVLASEVHAQRRASDSARVDRDARKAQAEFEIRRRDFLPLTFSKPNEVSCEVTIGRYCYWYADLTKRPEEPRKLQDTRQQLLRYLDNAAARFPGNDWINGQRVRYRIEAEDYDGAIRAAQTCQGTTSWCDALLGLAYHVAGRYAESEQVFDFALETMPEDVRCEFRSLELLLDGSLSKAYRESDCQRRAAIEKKIWWLADPMYSIPGNDRRTEHLSRQVMDVIYGSSRLPNGNKWGPDAAEIMLRYGFYTFWTREPPPPGTNRSLPSITDHQASPSFHFLPAISDLDSLESLKSIKWNMDSFRVRERYAPRYAKGFIAMDPQILRFIRGDSSLLVTSFDVSGDSAFTKPNVRAALVSSMLERDAPDVAVRPEALRHDTISLKTGPGWHMAGIEILSPDSQVIARSRAPVRIPIVNHALVSLSDILVFETDGRLADNLADAMSRMVTSNRVDGDRKVGLYWEIYDLNTTGESLPVALTLTRQRPNGALERMRENLGLTSRPTPLSIRWTEPKSNVAMAPRSILLDLSLVPKGKYDLRITLGDEEHPITATQRSIEIR
jgi:hypothetical protein